jgi:hypothetical protein
MSDNPQTANAIRCAVCGQTLGPGIHVGIVGGATFHSGCAARWKDAELARLRARIAELENEREDRAYVRATSDY